MGAQAAEPDTATFFDVMYDRVHLGHKVLESKRLRLLDSSKLRPQASLLSGFRACRAVDLGRRA